MTSASYPARAYGISAGMPIGMALRMCPRAVVVPVPEVEISRRHHMIQAVLDRFSPLSIAYSVDEWFVDLTGTELLYRGESMEDTASRIRQAVWEETQIAVSIGGGTQKTIAKMAAELAKPKVNPRGVYVVPPGEEAAFMRRFRLEEIPYVGRAFSEDLARRNVVSVEEALQFDEPTLVRWLGQARGRWLYAQVRGRDPGVVEAVAEVKSVGRGSTFEDDLFDDDAIGTELMKLVVEVCWLMRKDGFRARTVTLHVRDIDFKTRSARRTLPESIVSDRVVYELCCELFADLKAKRWIGIRALTVSLSNLVRSSDPMQLSLFGASISGETEKDQVVALAVDKIRNKHGITSVLPGRAMKGKRGVKKGRSRGSTSCEIDGSRGKPAELGARFSMFKPPESPE